ncbi:MAG TPA: indolepyruvate oxidoreductase subunit beta [bacterium]|nr:indolepyruvate oxidoreductase subunit beta [bacterium]
MKTASTEKKAAGKATSKEPIDILIVGVGGQGIILASRIISQALVYAGYDVKQSEVHGMAQRGGAVSSHIRAGEKVYSPLIPYDSARYMLSFESLEALRYMSYIYAGSTVLLNDQKIDPPSVASGQQQYPPDVIERIKKKAKDVRVIPAADVAFELGNERVVNVILTGALAGNLPVSRKIWMKTLSELVPAKLMEINTKAFERGMQFSNR